MGEKQAVWPSVAVRVGQRRAVQLMAVVEHQPAVRLNAVVETKSRCRQMIANHNLALGMTESVVLPCDLSTIEKHVAQASRYFSKKPLSVPKMKVLWVRGMIQFRFGSTRIGAATYRRVIAGFLKLGEIVDVALVSVSLGKQLHPSFFEHVHAELHVGHEGFSLHLIIAH